MSISQDPTPLVELLPALREDFDVARRQRLRARLSEQVTSQHASPVGLVATRWAVRGLAVLSLSAMIAVGLLIFLAGQTTKLAEPRDGIRLNAESVNTLKLSDFDQTRFVAATSKRPAAVPNPVEDANHESELLRRLEALQSAQAAHLSGDPRACVADLEAVFSKFGTGPLGAEALLLRIRCLLNSDRTEALRASLAVALGHPKLSHRRAELLRLQKGTESE